VLAALGYNVCDGLGGSAQRRLLKSGLALLGSDVVAWLLAARPAAERAYAAHGVLNELGCGCLVSTIPEPHLWPGMGVGALILEISARHKSKRALTTTVVIGPFEWSG
jgi:hypothetical protein